jgi:hypothetical protein
MDFLLQLPCEVQVKNLHDQSVGANTQKFEESAAHAHIQ